MTSIRLNSLLGTLFLWIIPVPVQADPVEIPVVPSEKFRTVDDVMSFCGSTKQLETACGALSAMISQTTNLSLICFMHASNDISEEVKEKYVEMFKQYDADAFYQLDIAPTVIANVNESNPGCIKQ